MVDKWLGCHSESVMSSFFPHFKLSKHDAFIAQCCFPFIPLLKVYLVVTQGTLYKFH